MHARNHAIQGTDASHACIPEKYARKIRFMLSIILTFGTPASARKVATVERAD